jgi:hypothetical protein
MKLIIIPNDRDVCKNYELHKISVICMVMKITGRTGGSKEIKYNNYEIVMSLKSGQMKKKHKHGPGQILVKE